MAEAGVGDANMAMAKPVSGIRAAMDAGPGGGPGGRGGGMQRRPSVKMQTMHWNQIPQDKLDKSIWATALDGDEKEEILDDDMKEIEKLFGVDNPKPGAKVGWADKPKKTQSAATNLLLIDGKRAQNLTIALSQYKNVAPDHFTLIRAVCALDDLGGRLKVDHLDNLQVRTSRAHALGPILKFFFSLSTMPPANPGLNIFTLFAYTIIYFITMVYKLYHHFSCLSCPS
jgi:hypothetical protein